MNKLEIPNTNTYITDGCVVRLLQFPNTKWIVHYGWYTYNGVTASGWYFSSIPDQTILPIEYEYLSTIEILTGGCTCPSKPSLPIMPLSTYMWELDRAAISVETVGERDRLSRERILPDGKIVRVNEYDETGAKYFTWNASRQDWDVLIFDNADDDTGPIWNTVYVE